MTIPKRLSEVIEEQSNEFQMPLITARVAKFEMKTEGTSNGIIVEAYQGKERVGHFIALNDGTGRHIADDVFVNEDLRGRGIATAMIRKAHQIVELVPYALTDGQVYRSEAGKKLALKELQLFNSNQLKTAGPAAAILPEVAAVGGEAAAGAGEAAGAEESAGAEGENGLNSQGSNNQSGSQGGQQGLDIPEPELQEPTAANPTTASKLRTSWLTEENEKLAFIPSPTIERPGTLPLPTAPFESPTKQKPVTPPSTPTRIPTAPEPAPAEQKQSPFVMPQNNNSGQHAGENVQFNKPLSTNSPEPPEPKAPSATTPAAPQPKTPRQFQKPKMPGLNLSLNIPEPITNLPTAADPRTSSVNDRLISLINEMNPVKKTTSWE
jgi:predicted GNAT family acetyltransferase